MSNCQSCANRGRVYLDSQESCCDHCIHGEPWKKDLYVPITPIEDNDFPLGKACDLSGEGACEACQ